RGARSPVRDARARDGEPLDDRDAPRLDQLAAPRGRAATVLRGGGRGAGAGRLHLHRPDRGVRRGVSRSPPDRVAVALGLLGVVEDLEDLVELEDLEDRSDSRPRCGEARAAPALPHRLEQGDEDADAGGVDELDGAEVDDDVPRTGDRLEGLGLGLPRDGGVEGIAAAKVQAEAARAGARRGPHHAPSPGASAGIARICSRASCFPSRTTAASSRISSAIRCDDSSITTAAFVPCGSSLLPALRLCARPSRAVSGLLILWLRTESVRITSASFSSRTRSSTSRARSVTSTSSTTSLPGFSGRILRATSTERAPPAAASRTSRSPSSG